MSIKQHLVFKPKLLKDHVNKYAVIGLAIALSSIIIASILVSYQLTGFIDFAGIILAQKTNPALWALDITPFMFAYWGQSFCYEVASTMESLIASKTRELADKSADLELKLQYETHHDHLTNLPNQRLLLQRISEGIKQLNKDEGLVLILLHLNNFGEINYKFGSFNGNNLLVQFAEKLKTILLEPYLLQAYMGMNMAARLQGAEFAILIPRLRKEHNLQNIINKILEASSANFMLDGNSIKVTTSAGIALYPGHGKNEQALLKNASASLFTAEKNNKPYLIYQESMAKEKPAPNLIFQDISKAIHNGEIELLYQPVFDLNNEKIVGVESFSYVNDSEQGKMDGDKIIALLQETDLTKLLTNLTFERIFKQLAEWQKQKANLQIFNCIFDVNDMGLPFFIDSLLQKYDIAPECVNVLLTEKVCLTDQTKSINLLNQLSELGIRILISDFGSGYSSFSYLTNFPISGVKIDKSFLANMLENNKKQNLVKGAFKFASALNLATYADNINDQNTLNKLKEFDCQYGQGSYFSETVNSTEISGLLVE